MCYRLYDRSILPPNERPYTSAGEACVLSFWQDYRSVPKEKMRINPISKTCMTLLLAIVSAGTLAGQGDGERRGGGREEGREQREQRSDEGRERAPEGRGDRQERRQTPQQERQSAPPQAPPPQQAQQPQQPQDAGRRPGRMTVEERRALRRQIDQASHDIYPQDR